MYEANPFFVFGRAAIDGLIVLVGTIVAMQKYATFRRRWYWLLLVAAVGYCLLSPFIYMAITSYGISLADAFLLRNLHAGSWHVAEAYSMLIGVVLGGLVGFSLSQWLSKKRRADKTK